MKTVSKNVLIWYSPAEMFSLVTDVGNYAQFLPWCEFGRVLETTADGVVAEIGIAMAGLRQSFVTRNTHVPDQQVTMELVRGPFSSLHGQWRFDPVGQGGERACRVRFDLQYHFARGPLGALVAPVFDKIAATFVDAFIQRAKQVYG